MIAKQPSPTQIYKYLRSLSFVLTFLILVSLALFVFFLFKGQSLPQEKNLDPTISQEAPSYDHVINTCLPKNSQTDLFPFKSISKKIYILGENTRPDASFYDIKIHLGLEEGEETIKASSGQKIFLCSIENRLSFSNQETPLWITPYLEKIELGFNLGNQHQEITLTTKELKTLKKPPLNSIALKILEGASWWGQDRLFEVYGGAEYKKLKNCERLLDQQGHLLYFKEGDYCIWKEGCWSLAQLGHETNGYPLAYIRSVSPYKIEWEVWDAAGFEKKHISHSKEKDSPLNLREEELFSKIRKRTLNQVCCQIGSKTKILKKGDWLVNKSSGWSLIKNLEEMDALLNFCLKGELFVFNGLEKNNNALIFSGTLFNPMRTQMKTVKFPLSSKKKLEYSPYIKKGISNRIEQPSKEDDIE